MGISSLVKKMVGRTIGRGLQAVVSWSDSDAVGNPALWNSFSGFSRQTMSGVTVGPNHAMGLPAFYACVNCIASDVGKLPLKTYKNVKPRGKEESLGDPIYNMLAFRPNPEMSSQSFREALTAQALVYGGGYAEIERDGIGRPIALWPIHPSRVRPWRDLETGELFYRIFPLIMGGTQRDHQQAKRGVVFVLPEDMFVIGGLSFDGVLGMSIIQVSAEALGVAVAAQQFSGSFLANGIMPSGVLEHPGRLSEEAQKRLKGSISAVYGGSENAGHAFIAEEGMKWNSITISPQAAQMIETQQFLVTVMCRLLRVPPHKVQDLTRGTFSNIEHLAIEYVQDCLMTWLTKWETEIKIKLMENEETFARFTVQALLRGDVTSRSAFYHSMIQDGSMTQNDVRDLEDMNPYPAGVGDTALVQVNLAPLSLVATGDHLSKLTDGQKNAGVGGTQVTPGNSPQNRAALPAPKINAAAALEGIIAQFADTTIKLVAQKRESAKKTAGESKEKFHSIMAGKRELIHGIIAGQFAQIAGAAGAMSRVGISMDTVGVFADAAVARLLGDDFGAIEAETMELRKSFALLAGAERREEVT